jgi:tol-pal system protein YbgF
MNRATVVACVVSALVTGCATHAAVRQVAQDLETVHAEVGLLRQAQDDLSRRLAEMATDARAAQAKTVELQATIAATATAVERLTARVEATDEAVEQARDALAAAVAAAATPPPPPAAVPQHPTEHRAGSVETAYAAGLKNFRNREYGQAILDFLDVVTKHPAHALAPTAQYWIGEAYYLQHDYRQALVEFQRVIDWGPPNLKVAEALVKTGLCYSNLREEGRAQQAWRRVLREFPETPAADEARTLLAQRVPAPSPSSRRP